VEDPSFLISFIEACKQESYFTSCCVVFAQQSAEGLLLSFLVSALSLSLSLIFQKNLAVKPGVVFEGICASLRFFSYY